jgi:hypothetical protein
LLYGSSRLAGTLRKQCKLGFIYLEMRRDAEPSLDHPWKSDSLLNPDIRATHRTKNLDTDLPTDHCREKF